EAYRGEECVAEELVHSDDPFCRSCGWRAQAPSLCRGSRRKGSSKSERASEADAEESRCNRAGGADDANDNHHRESADRDACCEEVAVALRQREAEKRDREGGEPVAERDGQCHADRKEQS